MTVPRDACTWSRGNIEAYMLEQLAGEDRRALDRHLATCSACADDARVVACVLGMIRDARSPSDASTVVHRTGAPAAVAALGAIVVVLLMLGLERSMDPRDPAGRGGPEVAAAGHVANAAEVDWLVAAQRADGSWGPSDAQPVTAWTVGITALGAASLLDDTLSGSAPIVGAARRACAFVAAHVDRFGGVAQAESLSPLARMKIQAAAAAALARAARRWPAEFGSPGGRTVELLRSLQALDGGPAASDRFATPERALATALSWRAFSDASGLRPAAAGLDRAVAAAARELARFERGHSSAVSLRAVLSDPGATGSMEMRILDLAARTLSLPEPRLVAGL